MARTTCSTESVLPVCLLIRTLVHWTSTGRQSVGIVQTGAPRAGRLSQPVLPTTCQRLGVLKSAPTAQKDPHIYHQSLHGTCRTCSVVVCIVFTCTGGFVWGWSVWPMYRLFSSVSYFKEGSFGRGLLSPLTSMVYISLRDRKTLHG